MSGDYIDILVPDGEVPVYLVASSADVRLGGIVLLQEIFGITENLRQTANAFAGLGYDVIVPDLFWRQEPGVELDPASAEDREKAAILMKGLAQDLAVDDALAAAEYLRAGGAAAIGVIGYCLGGRLAYLMAMREGVAAAVSYYGVAIESALDRAAAVRAPLLLHIGLEDQLCPPEAQARIRKTLGHLPAVEIMDHPDVGHAFARKGGSTYVAAAAQRADEATAAFLLRHLAPGDK